MHLPIARGILLLMLTQATLRSEVRTTTVLAFKGHVNKIWGVGRKLWSVEPKKCVNKGNIAIGTQIDIAAVPKSFLPLPLIQSRLFALALNHVSLAPKSIFSPCRRIGAVAKV